jgi:hypothetical protein
LKHFYTCGEEEKKEKERVMIQQWVVKSRLQVKDSEPWVLAEEDARKQWEALRGGTPARSGVTRGCLLVFAGDSFKSWL